MSVLSKGPFINVIYGWSLKQIICKEVSERSKMDWSEKGQIGKLKRRKNKFLYMLPILGFLTTEINHQN